MFLSVKGGSMCLLGEGYNPTSRKIIVVEYLESLFHIRTVKAVVASDKKNGGCRHDC